MEKIFLIADCHFCDEEVIRIFRRPFASAAAMDQAIAANWNRAVGPDDIIISVGDFCTEPEDRHRLLAALNGNKILIRGNHDRGGPEAGADHLVLAYRGQLVYLVHNPLHVPGGWDGWVIHGHRHAGLQVQPFIDPAHQTANVSCELVNYTPVAIDRIIPPGSAGQAGKIQKGPGQRW
jgi:calcineurin-like phosphoesterase family protein